MPAMNRPFLLRLLPHRLRASLYDRVYRRRSERYRALYDDARLYHAPQIQMSLIPGDQISDRIAFLGYYDRGLSQRVATLARQGGLMVDVGANLGVFSLTWAAMRKDNRAIALEASPRTAPRLVANVERNNLQSRITVLAVAAGLKHGVLPFALGPSDQTGWGGFASSAEHIETVNVPVLPLDEVVPADIRIALLKVDTEGADTWVLRGAHRLLSERRLGEVWYEQHGPRMRALGIPAGDAESWLQDHGYQTAPMSPPSHTVRNWRAVPRP
jgi:FkbM family methyltransferase